MKTKAINELFLEPIWGNDPDGEEGSEQEQEDYQEEQRPAPKPGPRGGQQEKQNDDGDDDDLDSIQDDRDRKIAKLSNENKNRRHRERELERELAAIKKAQQAKDDEKKDKADVLSRDLGKANEEITKLRKTNEALLLHKGITGNKEYKFHDESDVIALLNLGDIDIDPVSGTIEGLGEELKRIARDKPYLVAETLGKKRQQKQDGSGQGKQGASGINPGGVGTTQQDAKTQQREAIAKRFNL